MPKLNANNVRTAIIGCGAAAIQHIEAISLASSNSELGGTVVAVVDNDIERARELASRTGAKVRNLFEVLEDDQIDIVSICTPPENHASIAISALKNGKGVLIEKPVTRTIAELDAILSAAKSASAPAVAMLQHRGRLSTSALLANWTGDSCASIEVFRPRAREHYLREEWRHNPSQSGGGHVAHLGVHYIDLACQLLGLPNSVVGLADYRDVKGIDTRASLGVRFENGALMTIIVSAHPAPRSERLHVVDGDRELLLTDTHTEYRDGIADQQQPVPTPMLRAAVYQELWDKLHGRTDNDVYAIDRARGITMVLEAVRKLSQAEVPVS